MLSFPKGGLKGSAADIVRYVEARADGKGHGYYSGRGAPSEWGGELAREMGLSGPVDAKVLKGLLEGRAPDGTKFAQHSADRRMAKDLTWSAPKSCSIAANAGDERLRKILLEGHDRAVRRSMQFVEERYVTARYGKGGKEVERTGQALWSAFRHEESRAADGVATMQIHTHGLLLNVTKGRNGELRALDIDFGQDGVQLGGAVYQSEYAAFLRANGVELRQCENGSGGWELACITDDQIKECSPRSEQIVAELKRQNLDRKTATGQQKVAANLATRENKAGLSEDELRWEWRALCRRIGVNLENAYRHIRGQQESAVEPDPEQEPAPTAAASLKYATDHLSERESVINEQSTLLHALRHRPLGGITIDNLTAEVDAARADGNLVDAGAGRLVTRETLEREASNLAAVAAGRNTMTPLTDEAGALARISAREAINGFEFSAGQRQAVVDALTTTDQFWGIRGAAGVGKSTALAALADEAKARGFRVIGTGPSQTATDGTADAAPDDMRVLASFVMREEKDDTPRLILMDEAAMVSARDMEAFLQKVRPRDRVVFIGDPLQLAAVEAGSPFAQMMREKVIGFSEITEINRQREAPELLAVAQAFADGRNQDAVKLAEPFMKTVTVTDDDYKSAEASKSDAKPVGGPMPDATRSMLNLVKTIRKKHKDLPAPSAHDFKTVREWLDTHSRTELGFEAKVLAPQAVRLQAIARETAQAYLELSQDERAKTLVLAATNEMRRAINEKVKMGLLDQLPEGSDTESVTVTALDKSQCTRAELREAINYRKDMILRVPEGRGRAKRVVDWTVTASDPTRNTVTARNRDGEEKTFKPRDLNPKETGLYTKRDLGLAVGDRVVFTENNRDSGFQNNETGTVTVAGDGKVEVRKDDGKIVILDADQTHTLDHGWAVTVHRSQGRTVDRALVAGMASKMATAMLAYVACTRERFALRIFTDNIKALQKSWARVAERETAKDATEKGAKARETAPLEAARKAALAEVREAGDDGADSGSGTGGGGGQGDKAAAPEPEKPVDEAAPAHKPPPAPVPVVQEKEKEKERELGDSYGW